MVRAKNEILCNSLMIANERLVSHVPLRGRSCHIRATGTMFSQLAGMTGNLRLDVAKAVA